MLSRAQASVSRPLLRASPVQIFKGRRQTLQMSASSAPASAPVASPSSSTLSPEAKQRARAAVLGCFVADAATMPLHWIYDVPKMNELLKAAGQSASAPEFFPTPSCPFYQAKFGEQSPYGSELVPLLTTIAENGELDATKYSQAMYDYFTTGTAYRNHSIRVLIEKFDAGKRGVECGHETDFQANCFAKAAILVAKYGGSPQLLEKAEQAIRVQQNNDGAVKYGLAGVRLLEKVVVDGWSLDATLQWAVGEGGLVLGTELQALVSRALGAQKQPLQELQFEPAEYMKEMMAKHVAMKDQLPPFTFSVWCNGPACGNPAAFTNVAMAAACFSSYTEGVRANLMAGGDNCSRACLIGALLGAAEGLESIPQEWRKQTSGIHQYEALLDKLLA